MTFVNTWKGDRITLDFRPEVYRELQNKYRDMNLLVSDLILSQEKLSKNIDLYNINPYKDVVDKGVYILSENDEKLEIFPERQLALKCSRGQIWAENLRKQFYRSTQLAYDFATKLSDRERHLLEVCPVYLHFQSHRSSEFFKQVLWMPRLEGYIDLGQEREGLNAEFCQVFKIPSVEEISSKSQFKLHLLLDRDRQRQLLKIQTVYLFKRLHQKGINICSLNQKNILVSRISNNSYAKYILIDLTTDWFPPISPLYNALNYLLCN
ncbi:MAG: hypothetical protein KME17_20620 [Cyanosarcina radialis HA8281-LM2]|jgi:hypothetical protein|nr:hypothetical protein [Cyanosarcina radialis HA8281-LM2]